MTDHLDDLVRISRDLLKIRGEWCVTGIDETLRQDIRSIVADVWVMMRIGDDTIMADAIEALERRAVEGEPPCGGFTVTLKHEIPAKEIAYQFIAAIEGGSTYWCSRIAPKEFRETKEKPWYADPEVWADPAFVILVTEWDEEAEVVHEITHEAIAKGLQVMAEKHPPVFQEILDDNADAGTADIFLQCVVFGEEKYA